MWKIHPGNVSWASAPSSMHIMSITRTAKNSSSASLPRTGVRGVSTPTAIAADYVAIAAFALLARAAHQSEDMPFTFTGWLSTLWPFALGVTLGWLIVRTDGAGLRRGGIIWVITVVTGLVIWGVRNHAVPHWSFVIVATVTSALLMLGWRAVAGRFGSRR